MTNTSYVSLKQMAEDKTLESVGKVTSFAVDPRIIQRPAPGTNRPIDPDHVRRLADAYHKGALFPPLDVSVDRGAITPVDGQHRLDAALLAISEGAKIRALECRQFRGNAADAVLHQVRSQDGLKMTPLVLADRYRKLLGWGWTAQQVAEQAGKSAQHVRDTLALLDATPEVQSMLAKGQVSADVVRKAVRQHGADAGEVLAGDLEKAQAAGKTKVTPKTASTKKPSKLETALELLEGMRSLMDKAAAYERFPEEFVLKYRAFMGDS
jgi:ParB-like chromosome segregation protein Spo0J